MIHEKKCQECFAEFIQAFANRQIPGQDHGEGDLRTL